MDHPSTCDIPLDLQCPACREKLSLLSCRHHLSFRCKEGHSCFVDEFFLAHAQAVRGVLRCIEQLWEDRVALLIRNAGRARDTGHPNLAETLEREIQLFGERLVILREALAATRKEMEGHAALRQATPRSA